MLVLIEERQQTEVACIKRADDGWAREAEEIGTKRKNEGLEWHQRHQKCGKEPLRQGETGAQ